MMIVRELDAVEQIAAHLPQGARMSYYRTAAGTEMDVVVQHGRRTIGLEIKFSVAPTVSKGYWLAIDDLKVDSAYVVAPVERRFPLRGGAEVIPVRDIGAVLAAA